MVVVKNKLCRLVCFLLLVGIMSMIISSCNTPDDNIWFSPVPYEASSIEEFLEDWYLVQTGYYEGFTGMGANMEEGRINQKIEYLSNRQTVTVPVIKVESYVFSYVAAYVNDKGLDAGIQYIFVLLTEEGKNDDIYIDVGVLSTNDSIETTLADFEYVTNDNKYFVEKRNCWYIDTGKGYVSIEFPQTIDATDPSIVYEYFEFETIGIAEYESKMNK